jgi:DNA modification methylase
MDAEAILHDLHDPRHRGGRGMTYEAVAAKHETSPGTVHKIARERRALKHQDLRDRRAAEQRRLVAQTQRALLEANLTGNCHDRLKELPAASISLFCTSIPYNIGKPYAGDPDNDRKAHYVWLGEMLIALGLMEQALAPGGVMFVQVGMTHDHFGDRQPIDVLLFEHLQKMGLTFQDRLILPRPHGLTPKDHLADRYETALVFSKGRPRCFNANAVRLPQKDPGKRGTKGPRAGQLTGNPLGAWPTNVWNITPVKHGHGEKEDHPCQFPLELAERAVLLYTMPGDVVADPFSGTGTTLAAAKKNGRGFWGCDLFYEDLRAKRLAAINPDLASLLPGVTPESISTWQAEARLATLPAQKTLDLGV